ncbi:MAG: hypothetical protein KBG92_06235 [Spirochaetes bacterium]|nr:hypothetical protein [Spirochaetota bacterium]
MTIYHKTSQGWLKLFCNTIDFGRYPLDMPCTSFYDLLNSAVIDLIRTIPRSAQLPVMMFFLYYAGLKPGDKLDFFHNYYSPIWSIIPHILKKQENTLFSEILINHAAGTHAMAMLLHSLDDHLNDGDLSSNHLTLLIRSQAWKLLHDHLEPLTSAVTGGRELADDCLDSYYGSIISQVCPENLEEYLDLFRHQMATAFIVPLLLAHRYDNSALGNAVHIALESFGIAWRILDDIKDLEIDFLAGSVSAVSLSLPEEGKRLWREIKDPEHFKIKNQSKVTVENERRFQILESIIQDCGIITALLKRILKEIDNATNNAEKAGLLDLAAELRLIASPLWERLK